MMKRILPNLDPRAAPIIYRLAKPDRKNGLRHPLTLAILLAALTSAVGIAYVASLPEVLRTARFMGGSYQFRWNVFDALAGASLALLLISPPVIAALTAILVSRDSHSEAWVLIKVTNLTRRPVLQGYVMSALYRLRLLMAISFGVLPLIAFGVVGYLMRSNNSVFYMPDFDILEMLAFILLSGLILISLWILSWIAITRGVNYGLRFSEPALAAGLASVSMMILVILTAVVGYLMQSIGILTEFRILLLLVPLFIWIGVAAVVMFLRVMQRDAPLPDRKPM